MLQPTVASSQVNVEEIASFGYLAEELAFFHSVDPRVDVVAVVSFQTVALVFNPTGYTRVTLFANVETGSWFVYNFLQFWFSLLVNVAHRGVPL